MRITGIYIFCALAVYVSGCTTQRKQPFDPMRVNMQVEHALVSDGDAALKIAQNVLRKLLPPDEFRMWQACGVTMDDGIWIVRFEYPRLSLRLPIVIKIRQQTGAIVSYDNPNA